MNHKQIRISIACGMLVLVVGALLAACDDNGTPPLPNGPLNTTFNQQAGVSHLSNTGESSKAAPLLAAPAPAPDVAYILFFPEGDAILPPDPGEEFAFAVSPEGEVVMQALVGEIETAPEGERSFAVPQGEQWTLSPGTSEVIVVRLEEALPLDLDHFVPPEGIEAPAVIPTVPSEPPVIVTSVPGEAYFNEGLSLFDQGEFEQAIAQFDRALALDWESAELYIRRAWACQVLQFDFGDCSPEQAIGDYTRATELDPQQFWAYIGRGNLYDELGSSRQALSDLTRAVDLAPDDPNTYFHRGVYFVRHEQWKNVVADMTQAIPLAPDWPDLYGHRGDAYRQLEQAAEARADYAKFMELTEGNPAYDDWRSEVQQWLDMYVE